MSEAPPALGTWYADHGLDAEALLMDRLAGGRSCLTYLVTAASGQRTVLRRPPEGRLLSTAHDVLREARIIAALGGGGIPVPELYGACADPELAGAPFFVMEHIAGRVLHDADQVPAFLAAGGDADRVADSMMRVLAALHAVSPTAEPVRGLGWHSGFLSRQLARWQRQWAATVAQPNPAADQLYAWLRAHERPDGRLAVVHGDFRLGNLVHDHRGSIVGVLDWELCTLGDPMADVAYAVRYWDLLAGAALGGPPASSLAQRYADYSGRDLDELPYWLAFSAWRSAVIAEGVRSRVARDTDAAPGAAEELAAKVADAIASGRAAAGL